MACASQQIQILEQSVARDRGTRSPPASPVLVSSRLSAVYTPHPRPAAALQHDGAALQLDMLEVRRKKAAAARAEKLFKEAAPPPSSAPGPEANARKFENERYRGLLRLFKGRASLRCKDFELLCGERGLMANGALDAINELAFEATGLPLLSGGDPIEVNAEVLAEVLR